MHSKVSCVIVDDDPSSINVLTDYVAQIPRLQLIKAYTNPVTAMADLTEQLPDILLLDIDMPTISGLQMAERFKHTKTIVIFTTAYAEYAIKAFDLNARKYLLKPIELAKFTQVLTEIIGANFKIQKEKVADSFFLRSGERGRLTKINVVDIIQIQAANTYVQIFTKSKIYKIYMTMAEIAAKLSRHTSFFRVHRSFIVNTEHVSRIMGNMIYLDQYTVVMANQYKDNFMNYVADNTLISKRC